MDTSRVVRRGLAWVRVRLVDVAGALSLACGSQAYGLERPDLGEWRVPISGLQSGVLVDLSPAGNDATAVGSPGVVCDDGAAALSFGAGEYLTCGRVDSLESRAAVTMAVWFRRTAPGAPVSVGKGAGATNDRVSITAEADGFVYIRPTGVTGAWARTACNDTSWHHVAMAFDGSLSPDSSRLRLYLDGVPVVATFGAAAIGGTTPATNTGNLDIGRSRYAFATVGSVGGLIDSVSIWGRALTSAEVARVHHLGRERPWPSRWAWSSCWLEAVLFWCCIEGFEFGFWMSRMRRGF